MKTFADLDTNAKMRVAIQLYRAGIYHADTGDGNALSRRRWESTWRLIQYAAGLPQSPVCTHRDASPDETGHCSRCGRQWPTYGPERLPFP